MGTFPDLAPAPPITIPAGTFLVPVQIAGASNLQQWQFDLLFDNTVVEEVDPLDGSAGIYGAEFTPADASTQAFILGGCPFNALGLVDDVAGSYPSLLVGPSGDGILAYILFRFLDGQEANDPGFAIQDVVLPAAVPVPTTITLLAAGLATLSIVARPRRVATTRRRTTMGETSMRTTLRVTAGLLALCAFAALPFPAQAQTTANGPYYATPSWDQTLPSSTRFIILSNFNSEAALDRETGLVWDRFAGGIADWTGARNTCVNKVVGGRVGWRLPSVQELATLMDPLVSIGTRLPAGHPFVAFSDSIYWSATVDTDNSAAAWIAIFSSTLGTPQVTTIGKVKENTFHYLCVRGGGPLDRH